MLDNGLVSRIVSPDSPLCRLRLSPRQSYARRVVVPEKAPKARNAQYVTGLAKSSFIQRKNRLAGAFSAGDFSKPVNHDRSDATLQNRELRAGLRQRGTGLLFFFFPRLAA